MIADACLSIEELEEEIRAENDRKYAFYRMLHATDRVLWRLEELNRDGVKELPAGLGARIREALAELPTACLEPLVDGSVQETLDGIFDAQERLFRWRYPDRDDEDVTSFTAADLVAWTDVCRWLDAEGSVSVTKVPPEREAALAVMRERHLVFIRDKTHWRLYADWSARLERLWQELAVGREAG